MDKSIPTHAVKAVISDQEGNILFLQRNPARGAIANWDLPGGIVEENESDQIALERELYEELNVKANIGNEMGKWSFFRPFDQKTVNVTNYSVVLQDENIELSDEHIAFKWYSKAELSSLEVKDESIFSALGF